MTTEQIIRDQLERATKDVVGGPDLEAAVHRGRSTRRRRRGLAGLAAVAVLGVGAAGIHAVADDPHRATVHDVPAAVAPNGPTDHVPGTDIDAHLAAIVASHLPALPAPDDIYASDSHTAGPIPDADFATAEDWQATYTLGGGHSFLLMTSSPSEGPVQCGDCESSAVPGGTILRQQSQDLADGTWQFGTWFVRADGSAVAAIEYVAGQVDGPVPHDRDLADADLEILVQDPALSFATLTGA